MTNTSFGRWSSGCSSSGNRWGNSGQVSFAVVAVILLTTSVAAGAYIAKREIDKAAEQRQLELMNAMDKAVSDVSRELSLRAATVANTIITQCTESPVNQTKISAEFYSHMSDCINSSFPRTDGRFSIRVGNWTGSLFFVERKTIDLVPSEDVIAETLHFYGDVMDYSRLPPFGVERLDERTVNPYYLAVGNFSICVSAGDVIMERQSSFDRAIISALPFIESKLRMFESAVDGEMSDLSSMVGYMLTTLGELRVLEGYGQPMYTGLNTSEVLTELDVYRALAVGLLLEQARLFRDADAGFAAQANSICGGNGHGLSAFMGSKGRSLDPAEILLWFLGKTELELDPLQLVAQSIFGISDQLVVRILDYLGWLGLLDTAKGTLDFFAGSLDSLIAWATGEDKAKLAVVSWIRKTLEASGVGPAAYELAFSSDHDFTISVPERQYFVQDAAGNLYPVWVGNVTIPVDVSEVPLLDSDGWGGFYPAFKDHQTGFRSLLADAMMRFAIDIAGVSRLELDGLCCDPGDGMGIFEMLSGEVGSVDLVLDGSAIQSAGQKLPMFSAQFDLASELEEFISTYSPNLADAASATDSAYSNVTSSILLSARYSYIPDLVVPVDQQLRELVRADVESDLSWGIGPGLENAVEELMRLHLLRISNLMTSGVVKLDDKFAGPLIDSLCSLLVRGTGAFPSLETLVERQLASSVHELLNQTDVNRFKVASYVDLSRSFEFWEGDRESAATRGTILNETVTVDMGDMPGFEVVPYDESAGYDSLDNLVSTGSFLVQVKRPWDYDRTDEGYPNVHMTSLVNSTVVPYSTQWRICVAGTIDIDIISRNKALESIASGDQVSSHRTVRISLCIPIVLHSAWPLNHVDYNPTSTLVGDCLSMASTFCGKVWDKLEPVVGWAVDVFERVYRFVSDAFEVLAGFANKMVKALATAFQTAVETLQVYIEKIANSTLGRAVKAFVDIYGRVEFRISIHGFLIVVQTDIPDLLYRNGNDMLRFTVSTERFGPGVAFGIRLARLTDGSYDVLVNGTLQLKKTKIDVLVDPLMHILRRLVEVHVKSDTWALDMTMPESEAYDSLQVSTADIPGIGAILSNIPIPVLGLSASIEAGVQLKYSPPFPTDVVINEFESNPHGEDQGNEWVELYNPLDETASLDGWTLATLHGKNSALPLEGTLAPSGLAVFTFPETSIDNGDPDDPFNDGDAIVLLDPLGATVDITPVLKDVANDDRTNQRNWDGGPRWIFERGSKGGSNGVPLLLASSEFIAKSLFQAFKDAFVETQLQEVSPSLDFVVLFAKRVLNHLIDNLLSLISEIVHDVVFYLEIALSDASGSAGVGFRSSFVVTGEAIEDIMRWLVKSIATFIVNLGRPTSPIAYPTFPREFFSGLYISFELLFEVGLPKMVRLLGAVGGLDQRFALVVGISPNIPTLGKLAGRDWGNWSVEFGVCLEGVPREFVSAFLSHDTGTIVDLWLLKGRAYGI